jgi:multicomponent Na+:H+ antiporter subunit B
MPKTVVRNVILISALLVMLGMFFFSMQDLETLYNDFGKQYFFDNGFRETASRNLVTAILLDYRLFDSLFEAGILLVAVSGVKWISKHDIDEQNAKFMIDRYKTPDLFVTFARLVYPLMIAFGFYVVINGHLSPGGGFQGGAIIATAILILYYIDSSKETNTTFLVTTEKIVYIVILIVAGLSIFSTGEIFTNFFPDTSSLQVRSVYLVLLNLLVGLKVMLGLWTIFVAFLKEGR